MPGLVWAVMFMIVCGVFPLPFIVEMGLAALYIICIIGFSVRYIEERRRQGTITSLRVFIRNRTKTSFWYVIISSIITLYMYLSYGLLYGLTVYTVTIFMFIFSAKFVQVGDKKENNSVGLWWMFTLLIFITFVYKIYQRITT